MTMMIEAGEAIDPYYSAALDEIYALRRALAYERLCLRAHLDFLSLPKGVRNRINDAMTRITKALTKSPQVAYYDVDQRMIYLAVASSGMPKTLTRGQWEQEVENRKGEF